jgi:Fe-S cluster biogenesis protein NfuA/nitrite reductase/ring-hydroxylating ferredoxin subunit
MEFDKAVAELETLVGTLEREGDERALLLLQLVDAIHRPALELLARGERDHPLVRALLAMYDLAEPEPEVAIEEALDEIRPYVESHGGAVELVEISDGVVRVRMSGACEGCAASAMTLRRGIETAIRERLPQIKGVIAEEGPGPPAPQLLQLENVKRPQFVGVSETPPTGELGAIEVEGVPVLLANVGGEMYAFRNGCAVDGMPLDGGRLTGTVLVCPWHNCAYDARSGKRLDDTEQEGLAAVPVAVEDESVRVAVNVL